MTTGKRGDIAVAKIISKLTERGYQVSVPLSDHSAYDLVIDDGNSLLRAQCKAAKIKNGVIGVRCCSTPYGGGKRLSYEGRADVILAYCFDNDTVYRLSVDEVGRNEASLRLSPPKIDRKQKIRFAQEYELASVA